LHPGLWTSQQRTLEQMHLSGEAFDPCVVDMQISSSQGLSQADNASLVAGGVRVGAWHGFLLCMLSPRCCCNLTFTAAVWYLLLQS
jgi:hypothetical protein